MRTRTFFIAAIASVITEGVLFALFVLMGRIGPNGPDAGTMVIMVLHFPGWVVADVLGLGGTLETIVIVTVAFFQYLIAFSVIIILRRRWRVYLSNSPSVGQRDGGGDAESGGPGGGREEHR